MLDTITGSIIGDAITIETFLICTGASIFCGICIAAIYSFKNKYSQSYLITLVLLPAMVQLVIMLVNGNLGVGIAVMGAFNLVRFRSMPGSAREISSLFFAMAVGLATGMGYIFYGFLFLVIIGIVNIILSVLSFGSGNNKNKILRIAIPEDLEYDGIFDDLFEKYTSDAKLGRVRTTNMGSIFELSYNITLKEDTIPKTFIDDLRSRNGNMTVNVNSAETEGL